MKGKVVINYEHTDDGDCKWDIFQEGENELNNDDLIFLLESVVRDVIEETH